MKAFLGVSKKRSLLNLQKGDSSFWCTYPSYDPEIGDVLLLYLSGTTKRGVHQIYKIRKVDAVPDELHCVARQMKTVQTTLISNLDNYVSTKQLKTDPVLSMMGAVGRNFQSTIFKVRPEEWAALAKLISEMNPGMALDLNQ